jgi:hypothetical protein
MNPKNKALKISIRILNGARSRLAIRLPTAVLATSLPKIKDKIP